MDYTQVRFDNLQPETREQLIALLDDDNINGFEETDNGLLVYFKEGASLAGLEDVAANLGLSFQLEQIGQRNWNEVWESNFEPVTIGDFCSIRADFHPENKNVQHEILITPKMSFGTGHHATTMQMVSLMRDLDFDGKKVFDFGTGTGILAILAAMLGSKDILAIDNDEWAYVNAVENCERNNAAFIKVQQATIELVPSSQTFDIILANINRHILLDTMPSMELHLNAGGRLLLSGILENEDVTIVRESAEAAGLHFEKMTAHDKWAAMQFYK